MGLVEGEGLVQSKENHTLGSAKRNQESIVISL